MNEKEFEAHRAHLRSVAFRMLGSLSEADDAVQEAWVRLNRTDTGDVANIAGWLTTVVARVCLDVLRSRKSRAEEPALDESSLQSSQSDPESELLLADSVGVALLVILETLDPAERLAFVLHDVLAVPFEEIASIVGRSSDATRQLASRARRRIQGAPTVAKTELATQRKVVGAFLSALRNADMAGLLDVLDPDILVRVDQPDGGRTEIRGAANWAKGAIAFSRNLRFAEAALIDGSVGLIVARRGKLFRALRFTFDASGMISGAEVVAHRERLDELELAVLS